MKIKNKQILKSERKLIGQLQRRLDDVRRRIGISDRGQLLFKEKLDVLGMEEVIVEADGFGGAVLRLIEGNYPADYEVLLEHTFRNEADAEEAATYFSDNGDLYGCSQLEE